MAGPARKMRPIRNVTPSTDIPTAARRMSRIASRWYLVRVAPVFFPVDARRLILRTDWTMSTMTTVLKIY